MNLLILFFAGEVFLVLFVLFFAVCFPIILIVIVFYVLRRNNKYRAVWQSLSREFNLHMPNPKQLRMTGKYNGCDVVLSIGVRRSGGEDSHNEYFTYCQSEFPYSLRMLLNIRSPKGFLSGVFKSKQIKIAHEAFDNTFNSSCYDGQVLRKLLLSDFPSGQTQNLMGDLFLTRQTVGTIKLSDNKVYLEKSGQIGEAETLRQMLELTSYLANRFYKARLSFPLADWEKQLISNWENLARENNLQFDKDHFHLHGNYKNFPLLVDLRTDRGKWQTIIKLNFPRSLMVGLKLMPENSIHKALSWIGVQDIEAGIKEFDDAFIVKAKNIQMAKHLLQPDLCKHLVLFSRKSSGFLIDDESMSFTFDTVLGDEKMLKSYIEGMISTSKMLMS
jgi:hypothetical protein